MQSLSKTERAAEVYVEFELLTMALCKAIKGLHGDIKISSQDGDEATMLEKTEYEIMANLICHSVEKSFHQILDPYVKRLEEMDLTIKSLLPKPPGALILPGDDIN